MQASRPAVHPVEAPPPAPPTPAQPQEQADGEGVVHPRGVRMKDPPGAPGTPAGLGLRLAQTFFAAAALAVMAATNDFPSVSAFRSVCPGPISWIPLLSFLKRFDRLVDRQVVEIIAIYYICWLARVPDFSYL
jgi:hypothetical protein